MCSVRHSPMPSAPNSRAFTASSGRSAFVRTRSVRKSSAQPSTFVKSPVTLGSTSFTAPTTTSPVVPFTEITSPSRITVSPAFACRPSTSISRPDAPHTAGVPMPRATTAAWLTSPPREVRMPCAAIIPCRSSGDVSGRTSTTASPCSAAASASSAVKYTLPTAAPGDAFRPLVTAA